MSNKIKGVVKSIIDKGKGVFSMTLHNQKDDKGKDIFFSGFDAGDVKKGDTVEFEHKINNKFHNFSNLTIIDDDDKLENHNDNDYRNNIDAGNILRCAVDLVIAHKDLDLELDEACKLCVNEFNKIRSSL